MSSALWVRRVSVLGAVVLVFGVSACSNLSVENRATASAADVAAVRISNNALLEHFEDMTQQNLLIAAAQEGLEVVGVSRLEPQNEDSFYEWNELIIRVEGLSNGFNPKLVDACWKLVFEGRFQRGDEQLVGCPTSPPPVIEMPTTLSLPTLPPEVVARSEQLVERIRAVLISLSDTNLAGDALTVQVQERLRGFETSAIETTITNGRVAIAVADSADCYFGLATDPVDVWQPIASDIECTAENAALGGP